MIKFDIFINDVIYINSEKYFIKKIKKDIINFKKIYLYILGSDDGDIVKAQIFLFAKNNIVFELERIVNFRLKRGGAFLGDGVYQLTKEKEEVFFNNKKEIERKKIYELHNIKERVISNSEINKIVVYDDGKKILYNRQKLKVDNIKIIKPGEIERPKKIRKFKIKFKEPIG